MRPQTRGALAQRDNFCDQSELLAAKPLIS